MRDIKRIRKFCNQLATVWETCPDLRFGQLISNVFCKIQKKGMDAFELEEDEMIDCIDKYYKGENIK